MSIEESNEQQLELFRRMSPEQKLQILNELYRSAWNLKAAALRSFHKDLSEAEIYELVRKAFLYARS